MDLDPLEYVPEDDDDAPRSAQATRDAAADRRKHRLNAAVAITVALLATFMGICKVKDDNIVQGMQQAQADKIDHWNYYQARNIREDIAEATVAQLKVQKLQQPGAPAATLAAIDAQIDHFQKIVDEQSTKKLAMKAQAEADQKQYDALNFRDDQFDLSDALLAVAIALLAVTSLTQMGWLYVAALVPSGFGVLMGVAGLTGMGVHPDALIRLLS